MGLEMRLAKVIHRVVANLPIAVAMVATAPLVAVAENGSARYAPSGYPQAVSYPNAGYAAGGEEVSKGPLIGGGGNRTLSWPKLPLARSKPSDRTQNVAQRPPMDSRTMRPAAPGQRFAGRQRDGGQLPPQWTPRNAVPAYTAARQAQPTTPPGRAAQSANQAAPPSNRQAITVASRPQAAPIVPSERPTEVAPQSPTQ